MAISYEQFLEGGVKYLLLKLKNKIDTLLSDKVDVTKVATDTELGLVKLNPSESISLNADNQLVVGGRLGQFPNGGLYYPTSAAPSYVGNYTLLMSEAKGLNTAHRDFIVAGGTNVTLKTTAQAGATIYAVSNTQSNRFICSCFRGGRLAVSENGAKTKTVKILSVKFANGNDVVPYFGGTESNNNILITVEESLNPTGTLSQVRGYGTWTNADIISAGQGNRGNGGKIFQVGQACQVDGDKNQIAMIGIRQFSNQGSSILVGADNINKKQYSAIFGQGHDNTNGVEGGACFGRYSYVDSNTFFAVGNGSAYNNRSNAFEVTRDGGVVLKSPNGTRFKVTVDDNGNLSSTPLS